MRNQRVVVGVTGASGAIYAQRLLETLASRPNLDIILIASRAGLRVAREELGVDLAESQEEAFGVKPSGTLRVLPIDDIGADPATGSYAVDAMAIVPCSMRTLGAVAAGLADNLITRAADVCVKEGRRLVLTPRECPFSALHLENMLRLARLGVRIVPPVPGFYQHPKTIDDLVDFVVERIVGQMGL